MYDGRRRDVFFLDYLVSVALGRIGIRSSLFACMRHARLLTLEVEPER